MASVRAAAIATGTALVLLAGLGTWQLQRLQWKTALLARIDAAEKAPPVPLAGTPLPFAKVQASGIWHAGTALYGVDARPGPDGALREGAYVLQIMDRPGLPPLLVNRGWLPEGATPPADAGTPAAVTGYVREADTPTLFSPEDDPEARRFYTLSPAAIAPALGVQHAAPFTLVAIGAPSGPNARIPADALPRPPNNHLQYAFTWFGLGLALVAVFITWLRTQKQAAAGLRQG